MFHIVNTKTQDVDTLFGAEKVNEDVSLLGNGVGVTVVSNGLDDSRKRSHLNSIQ